MEHLAFEAVEDSDGRSLARNTAAGVSRYPLPALELRNPVPERVCQRLPVYMNDDLEHIGPLCPVQVAAQGKFGQQCQGVGAELLRRGLGRRRFRGIVLKSS
jgi:hypothetical protein